MTFFYFSLACLLENHSAWVSFNGVYSFNTSFLLLSVGRIHFKPFCQNIGLDTDTMTLYRRVLAVVQYAIPLCIISFVYIRMALRLWGSKAPGNAQDSRDATLMKNKKKVSSLYSQIFSFHQCLGN